MIRKSIFQIILIIGVANLFSCRTQNLFEPSKSNVTPVDSSLMVKNVRHYIQPDDKISLSIWNHDDLSVGSIFGIYNSNEVYGKWVLINPEGEAEFPKIGKVKIGGLNTDEAAEKLKNLYSKFILDPIIVVKVLNREVTVLGEVFKPGTFLLEKEENTLFEIIGKAGGLDFYADKKNVKFIREEKEYLLDLTKMDDFTLNNIILQPKDIIYIPTRKGKMVDKKSPTLIPITSVITTLVILFSLL